MADTNQLRDSHGRFKADHRLRNRSMIAGAALAAGAGLAAAIWRGWVKMPRTPWANDAAEGHEAPDLALGGTAPGSERAPEHFRPDPEAIPTDAEREALKPASIH